MALNRINKNMIDPNFIQEVETVKSDLAQTENDVKALALKPTLFGDVEKSFTDMAPYNSWSNDTLFYDDSTDEFVMFTTSKSAHGGVLDSKGYMTKKKGYDNWTEPVLMAEGDETRGRRPNGAGMLLNGNYLVITTEDDTMNEGNIRLYESADKGATWTNRLLLVDGQPIFSGDCSDFLMTSTGRILTWTYANQDYVNHVLYSDDQGQTWNKVLINNNGMPQPLEGNFCELSNGCIIALGRATISPEYTTKRKAFFTRSYDNGTTWEPLKYSATIEDMTENNCSFVYNKAEKTVEVYVASRYPQADGKGSIFYYLCHEADAEKDNFGVGKRIFTGAPNSDFGYPATCKSPYGLTLVSWYDGVSPTQASIYHALGNAVLFPKNNDSVEKINVFSSLSTGLFEQGTIFIGSNTTWNASKLDSALRLRTIDTIKFEAGKTYELFINNKNYKYFASIFYDDGTTWTIAFTSDTTEFKPKKSGVMGFGIAYVNDAGIDVTKALFADFNVGASVSVVSVVNKLDTVDEGLIAVQDSIRNNIFTSTTNSSLFEQGTFSIDSNTSWNASKVASSTRIRTVNTIPFEAGKTYYLSIANSNYKYCTGVFYDDNTAQTIAFTSSTTIFKPTKNGVIGFGIAYVSDVGIDTTKAMFANFAAEEVQDFTEMHDVLSSILSVVQTSIFNTGSSSLFEQGTGGIVNGDTWDTSKVASTTRLRSISAIAFNANDTFIFDMNLSHKYTLAVFYSDSSESTIFSGFTFGKNKVKFSKAGNFGLILAKSSDETILPADIANTGINITRIRI